MNTELFAASAIFLLMAGIVETVTHKIAHDKLLYRRRIGDKSCTIARGFWGWYLKELAEGPFDKIAECYSTEGRSVLRVYLDEQGEIATKLIKPEEFLNTEPPKE